MKGMKIAGSVLVLSSTLAFALPATAAEDGRSVCLRNFDIDHTQVIDDQTILFHMRDGKVWKNTLHSSCTGLSYGEPYVQYQTKDQFCANAQVIRMVYSGSSCRLGNFTAYEQGDASETQTN